MTYEDFQQYLAKQVMYEARYKDSEGRDILVICELDAFAMVNKLVRAEREACTKVCDIYALANSESDIMADAFNHCSAAIRARGEK